MAQLQKREITPGQFFLSTFDGKFVDFDLNAEGSGFAAAYYAPSNGYFRDYEEVLGTNLPTLYHVEDSWTTFEMLKPRIDLRFEEWKRGELSKTLKNP